MATDNDVSRNLKRTVTLPQALGFTFHQVVGGGVVALMGVAIAMTGAGTPAAFLIAAAAVILYSLPIASLASALPVLGGRYAYAAKVFSPSAGFASMWCAVLVTVQLSLMALAGAQYAEVLIPGLPVRPIAFGLITVFFIANLFGAALSSRIGIVLAFVMLAAFGLYGFTGLGSVDWSHFSDITPHGVDGLLATAALLTFATTGAVTVADLGGEMKRPARDIPMAVIAGTIFAALLYVLVAIPSVGVLGPEAAANKPMTAVAQQILSPGGVTFFIIGGALFAVIGHINSLLLGATKPVLAAISDGWLPGRLGAVNKRYGTPHWLLFILYIVGAAPILLGFSVASVASMASVAVGPILMVMVAASWRLRRRMPRLYAAAPFRLPKGIHIGSSILGIAVLMVQTYLLVEKLALPALIALGVWGLLGLGIWLARRRHVRNVVAEREPTDPTSDDPPNNIEGPPSIGSEKAALGRNLT